jgi:hypothetical protein
VENLVEDRPFSGRGARWGGLPVRFEQ